MSLAVENARSTFESPPREAGAAAIRSAPLRARTMLLRMVAVLAILTAGWGAARLHLPRACFDRGLAALHLQDATGVDLERVQYELCWLEHAAGFEAQASLLKAKLLLAAGRYTAALDKLSIADSDPQTQPYVLVLAGEGLYKSGRFTLAGSTWVEALKQDPSNVGAVRWLGVAYYELGATEAAVHYLTEVGRLDPKDPRPFRVIGLIWMDVDEFQAAADAYRESLRRDPNQPEADQVRFEFVQALHELHEDREALKVLELCPANADAKVMRAACLYNLGNVEQAAPLLDEAIAADERHLKALTLRAKIALDRSEAAVAARLSEKAALIRPRSPEVLNLLIAVYLRLGQHDKAKAQEAVLKEVNSQLEDYHNLVSKASSEPDDATVRYRAGLLASKLDLRDAAKWWLRAAVYLEPDNQQAATLLEQLESPYHRSNAVIAE